MKREEIAHLAMLARIELTDAESERLAKDLSSIVSYVSVVADIAGTDATPQVGVLHNVFRLDVVTNEPYAHTRDLLAEMPHTDDGYLKVKKILTIDE